MGTASSEPEAAPGPFKVCKGWELPGREVGTPPTTLTGMSVRCVPAPPSRGTAVTSVSHPRAGCSIWGWLMLLLALQGGGFTAEISWARSWKSFVTSLGVTVSGLERALATRNVRQQRHLGEKLPRLVEKVVSEWPLPQFVSLFLPEFPVRPPMGQQQLKILGFVAKGSFGTVLKVLDCRRDKVFAMKVGAHLSPHWHCALLCFAGAMALSLAGGPQSGGTATRHPEAVQGGGQHPGTAALSGHTGGTGTRPLKVALTHSHV
uniref:Uncharacterized protein n=1 Tax=Pelusios castaneus TaxID=367368 RepID=A0A8C8VL93_9SAUR